MAKRLFSCCLLLFTWLSAANADPVRLVTSGGLLPFTDEDWKAQGMLVDIVDQVMRVANLEHEIVFQPNWNTMLADTEEGQFHATFPWYFNEERAQRFLYTDSLVSNYIMAFSLRNSDVQAGAREELAGHRFCRPQGYFIHDLTDLLRQPGTTLEQPETLIDCFQLLKDDRVDVVPVDLFSSFDAILSVFDGPNAVRRLSFVFSRQKMHIIVPRNAEGAQELVSRINRALVRLELHGVLQSIRDNHASMFLRLYQ